ncbi:type VI secretion system ATPase TssH [Serratia sp. DD3]|uniref:type VI secretion system ATPase TssH n=1 Tax=Serratia sp. DD3 TaxID=1410619 RepID=UPI0003C4EA86|nr:type VI secretion system ATPase TssH [Serratia sp. DD3]KEY58763.1 chaperone protein ClpB [Serratia sp. DD3]
MSEISRAVLFGKLNGQLLESLENATAFCKLRGNPYVELAHWIHQLMQYPEGDWQRIIHYFDIDAGKLSKDIIAAIDRLPRGASSISDLSEHIDNSVERSWIFCSLTLGSQQIRGGHLLLGLLKTTNLHHQLLAISPCFSLINSEILLQQFELILTGSSEADKTPLPSGTTLAPGSGKNVLEQYGNNLTEKARRNELDPVIGRDEEIRQLIDILMRRRQNNPLLTGEAGVGKTAVVEGLAARIAAGEVPPKLRDVTLYLLDMGMLQAGAGAKGEFEQRLRAVIDEVQSSPSPIILFIDEIHTLIGAGGTQGTGDAANLMKPALARGQLRTIGATTWSEYKKYIEKDPALTRRFQVVKVLEPDEKKAVNMLRHLRPTLERHHQVIVLDESVEAAVRLSHRYIPDRQLPDKAISLMDTACARCAVSQHAEPAQVEDCRRHIEALETEWVIASRDARIAAGDAERPNQLKEQIEQARQQLDTLSSRWKNELELVNEIIELRARLYDTDGSADENQQYDAAALHVQLAELQQQLAELQACDPLIFPTVDANIIAAVIADWTGIPLGRMMKSEIESVLGLAETLNQRVIGQKHGLEAIASRLITSRASLDDPNKPIGVFMLCGPSGVGKTETAHALAESFYGGERHVITINMSEFQESHTVSTLKGAPPGYVGYGEGGILTEAVRRRPYSVILLDEVEKAHSDVHEIFYQVFDKGWMEDGEGLRIDFRNTIIILTSNVGSEVVSALCSDPALLPDPEQLTVALREPLLRAFPAALLGRLMVVPYYPLNDEVLADIVKLRLERIRQRLLENHNMTCSFDDRVVQQIVSRCTDVESGGRLVDTILTNTLLPQISHYLLTASTELRQYHHLHIDYVDKNFDYDFQV